MEFLYDLQFWEAKRILKGYENRNRSLNELLRLNAYYTCFAFRKNDEGRVPRDIFEFPWERDRKRKSLQEISDEQVQDELDMINALNAAG